MGDVETLDAQAQALRNEGLTYPEIGRRMGESTIQAWRRCNRERDRAHSRNYRSRNLDALRAYGRDYEKSHRVPCERCGALIARGGRICQKCISADHDRKMRKLVQLWADGKKSPEIQVEMGWSEAQFNAEMHNARRQNYDLPYRYKPRGRTDYRFPEQRVELID